MKKIVISARSIDDLKETLAGSAVNNEIVVPLKMIGNTAKIQAGDEIEIVLAVKDSDRTLELAGTVKWKRMQDINLPGRRIPAAIGIGIDGIAAEMIKHNIDELALELDNIDEEMAGGNYIKVRSDLVEKYKIDFKKNDFTEKRAQPRISVTIPVEIFVKNTTKKFKTLDISLLGMCIATNEILPVGEEILIILSDVEFGRQFLLKGVVLRNIHDKSDKDKISIGIKFLFEDEKQKKELMKFIIKKA